MKKQELSNDVITHIRQEICDKEFSSFEALQLAFDNAWTDVKQMDHLILPEGGYTMDDLLADAASKMFNFSPSILNYAKKKRKNKYIFPYLKLFKLKEVTFWSLPQDSALFENLQLQMSAVQKLVSPATQPGNDQLKNFASHTKHANLLRSMRAVLTHAYALNDGTLKDLIIREAKIAFKSQGLKLIEFDGQNLDEFEVKESIDCETPKMVSATLRYEESGDLFRKGIVFIPDEEA